MLINNYELHITFRKDVDLIPWLKWCRAGGGKPLLIILDSGKHPIQPMIGLRGNFFSDKEAEKFAAVEFESAKFWGIERVKLEAANLDGQAQYFEAHWKYTGKLEGEFPGFMRSDNLLTNSHYLTRRAPSLDHSIFPTELKLQDYLGPVDAKVHYERVLFDSNKDLDTGWSKHETHQKQNCTYPDTAA